MLGQVIRRDLHRIAERTVFKSGRDLLHIRIRPDANLARLEEEIHIVRRAGLRIGFKRMVDRHDLIRQAEIEMTLMAADDFLNPVAGGRIVPGHIDIVPLAVDLHLIPRMVVAARANSLHADSIEQHRIRLAVAVAYAGRACEHAVRPVIGIGRVVAGVHDQPVVHPQRLVKIALAAGSQAFLRQRSDDFLQRFMVAVRRKGEVLDIGIAGSLRIGHADIQRVIARNDKLIGKLRLTLLAGISVGIPIGVQNIEGIRAVSFNAAGRSAPGHVLIIRQFRQPFHRNRHAAARHEPIALRRLGLVVVGVDHQRFIQPGFHILRQRTCTHHQCKHTHHQNDKLFYHSESHP